MKTALILGIRAALRHRTAAIWTYVLVLCASLPFAVSIGWLVQDRFGHSGSAATFARGLDPVLWLELLRDRRSAFAGLIPGLAAALIPWTMVSAYAHGAVLSVVSRTEPSRTNDLFGAGSRVFGRLLRLTLLGLPFVALATGLWIWILVKMTGAIGDDWVSEKGLLTFRLAATLLGALGFAWAGGAYGFMRVEAVARGEHRARYAFVRGLSRAVRHPIAVLIIQVPFGAGAILLTLVASLADAHLSRGSFFAIGAAFLLEQAVVLARVWLKVSLAGSEVAYVMLSGR